MADIPSQNVKRRRRKQIESSFLAFESFKINGKYELTTISSFLLIKFFFLTDIHITLFHPIKLLHSLTHP